ncbi:MAG TPA: hypothetical protein VFY92_10355 [Hyphomicrobiaceae bacterium]|nr:hypothetical protein [Hyphomicrobiaceae bacterium]
MKATTRLLLAASSAVLLSASAAGEELEFRKRGTSAATQKRDSAQCWRAAQKVKLTEDQKTQNLVTAYLVGGIIGVAVVSSENDDANSNPKSTFRRQLHDTCMEKRGYRKPE